MLKKPTNTERELPPRLYRVRCPCFEPLVVCVDARSSHWRAWTTCCSVVWSGVESGATRPSPDCLPANLFGCCRSSVHCYNWMQSQERSSRLSVSSQCAIALNHSHPSNFIVVTGSDLLFCLCTAHIASTNCLHWW